MTQSVGGVMVIVVWNGSNELSTNPEKEEFSFHLVLILMRKVGIYLFSHQLWVNSWADWSLKNLVRQPIWEKEKVIDMVDYFNGTPTPFSLSNAEIRFIYKC